MRYASAFREKAAWGRPGRIVTTTMACMTLLSIMTVVVAPVLVLVTDMAHHNAEGHLT